MSGSTVHELVQQNAELEAENRHLHKKVEELEKTNARLEKKNTQLQSVVDSLHGQSVQPTHRNILYSEEKNKKRLPVFETPVRGARELGSMVFGECFAVRNSQDDGQDLWLQIHGGDHADQWVLGRDAGTVHCVNMTKYLPEQYGRRIDSSEYNGQHFPKKTYTEGFPGSSDSNICLISASGDSFWRELNIEMLFRGIATATVFEQAWGGDKTFTDWVAYYAVNCVQYGQLRTPLQKHLLATVKPTSRWRNYQPGRCCGPELESLRDDIGKAQYKECSWLKGMKEQLHVKWNEVEFLTAFAFLREHCAWSDDDCRRAANERLLWVLQEFFNGGYKEKAAYELERAYWLWDEAFDGCTFEEATRARAYDGLQQCAKKGCALEIPQLLRTASAASLAWVELAAVLTAQQEAIEAAITVSATAAGRLAAGSHHSVWLDDMGMLRSCGNNDSGQRCAPTLAPGESWAAVSVGGSHTLGLTDAGVLRVWGSSLACSAPALECGDRWVAVSAGDDHSLGITAAGALRAWGDNKSGECDVPALPAGERWAAASGGLGHSLGITAAGALHAWGDDGFGQCSGVPVLCQGRRWIAVSAGYGHSLGLTADGELHAWGADYSHQCSGKPVLAPGEHWIAASAAAKHSLGVTSTGALHAWGSNEGRQCNVPAGEHWLAASAGSLHSLGLTTANIVLAWGKNTKGQVPTSP